jgi:hypothetical protein
MNRYLWICKNYTLLTYVLLINLQSESNLDFENRDKSTILSWLEHIITVLKMSQIF